LQGGLRGARSRDRPNDIDPAVAPAAQQNRRAFKARRSTDKLSACRGGHSGCASRGLGKASAALRSPRRQVLEGRSVRISQPVCPSRCHEVGSIDLGKSMVCATSRCIPPRTTFNQIGEGLVSRCASRSRFRDDSTFASGATLIGIQTKEDFANPRLKPVTIRHASPWYGAFTATHRTTRVRARTTTILPSRS